MGSEHIGYGQWPVYVSASQHDGGGQLDGPQLVGVKLLFAAFVGNDCLWPLVGKAKARRGGFDLQALHPTSALALILNGASKFLAHRS